MDRRNFLRMGSLAVLGSLAAPSLALPDTVRGALGGTDNKSAVAAAMKHFGVTEADLKKVLTVALEKGGDYADLYFEHSFNNAVALMDGKVNNCSSNIDFGMGVRVLAGDQSGYAYVEGALLPEGGALHIDLVVGAQGFFALFAHGEWKAAVKRAYLYR